MRTPLTAGVVLLLALAGCDRPRPAAAAGDAAAEEALPDTPAPPVTVRASFQCPRPAIEGEPALPLDAPLSALQRLICAQPDLALLDRRVHEAYLATRLRSGVDRGNLAKRQTQWQADRDTCLKAADPSACVDEALRTRLVELALQDPQTVAGTRVAFVCEGTGTPLTAAFYSRFDPPFAVLGFGKQQAVVFLRPTNAGLKYERSGANLFVHQGRVEAELYGRTLDCVLPSSPWLRAPAPAVAAAAGAGAERTEAAPVAGTVRAEAAPAGGAASVQAMPANGAASVQATPAPGAAPIPAASAAGAALAEATPAAGTASAEAAPVVPTPSAASARPATPARPAAPAFAASTVPVVTRAAVAAPASAVAAAQGPRATSPQPAAQRPSTPASTSTSTPRPGATKLSTTAIATAAPSRPARAGLDGETGVASAAAPARTPPTRPISGQPQAPLLALASRPAPAASFSAPAWSLPVSAASPVAGTAPTAISQATPRHAAAQASVPASARPTTPVPSVVPTALAQPPAARTSASPSTASPSAPAPSVPSAVKAPVAATPAVNAGALPKPAPPLPVAAPIASAASPMEDRAGGATAAPMAPPKPSRAAINAAAAAATAALIQQVLAEVQAGSAEAARARSAPAAVSGAAAVSSAAPTPTPVQAEP